MSLFRPIHHTFAPLGNARQCLAALGLLVQPWKWRNGDQGTQLERAFTERFGGQAFAFASGREALLAILRSLKLTAEEEIIVQGYTCIVVPNAILAAGCVPVYVDIDRDSLNLNLEEIEQAITPKTRAIICQHTFGIPADTARLRTLCDAHSLLLIEDCAHIIPDESGPREIGAQGDILFFSFGRDKAISGITGGLVLSRDTDLSAMLAKEQEKARSLSFLTIGALLLYPLLYALCRPLYGLTIGKVVLAFCGSIGLLRPIVTGQEKQGSMPETLHRIPNACAHLALEQWHSLKAFNDHRRIITDFYLREGIERNWFKPDPATGESPLPLQIDPRLPLQKFPFFVLQADPIRRTLTKHNIHLNDGWTNCVICPSNADGAAAGYREGLDPQAEVLCEKILSLPTHPGTSLKDAKKLVHSLSRLV